MLATLRETGLMRPDGMMFPANASRRYCGFAVLTGLAASKPGFSRVVSGS
jgi:hypothetical protein